MVSLQRFGRRVLEDVKARRNLDTYVVSGVALILVVLTLLPIEIPDKIVTAVILAALSLLVLNLSSEHMTSAALDDYLNDRANFIPFKERIKGARTLWIYAPSAANIFAQENAEVIRQEILLHNEGEFRIIIQNPQEQAALDILTRHLDDEVEFQVQHLPDEIKRTLSQIQLMQSWKLPGKFDYRLLDFGPGFSLVAVDPEQRNGQIIVEIHGFHNQSTSSRMNIELTRENSERWYTYWMSQFEAMWNSTDRTAKNASTP